MKNFLVVPILSILMISCYSSKKTKMEKKSFKFYTEYRQFYLEDSVDENKGNVDSPNFWTEESFNERLAFEKGIIGVGTQSYGNIKGEIALLKTPNINVDYSKYDHIVEGSITLQSGELQVSNCPDRNIEASLKVNPGKYRVRVYSSNLASVKESDLAHDTDNDYYLVELWPSEEMGRKVLKQYLDPNDSIQ